MAWRDSRTSRRRLLLLMSSIVLGVAALVAISSFRDNLQHAIDDQARELAGADLILRSRQPFSPEATALLDSLTALPATEAVARQTRFASMVYFRSSVPADSGASQRNVTNPGGTRLAQVRALSGDFPFYGELQTEPRTAARTFRDGPYTLIDDAMMIQFGAEVGDTVTIGEQVFTIAGRLLQTPGEAAASAFLGPRVYIPMRYLEATKLIQTGSIARYYVYYKFNPGLDAEALAEAIRPGLTEDRVRVQTIESRREMMGEAVQNLYRYLNLVGFIALILGGVGIASAIHVYVKQKLSTIAILRCVGASTRQIFVIYLVQAMGMGFFGALVGSLLGVGVQVFLPAVVADFLPVQIEFAISWLAVIEGLLVGLVIAVLFVLLPLASVRNISPMLTLRSAVDHKFSSMRDPLFWLIHGLIGLGVTIVAIMLTDTWRYGIGFSLAIGVVFGLLALVAKVIMAIIRRFFPTRLPYIWRQGLSNLFRPNNQTIVLMIAIGLGTFLVMTLYQSRTVLLEQIDVSGNAERPNLILFDIQLDQINPLKKLIANHDLPVLQEDPVVTNRLLEVNGRRVTDLLNDPNSKAERWTLRREYRSTYRDYLTDTEEILEGEWVPRVEPDADVIPISLEREVAKDMAVGLGDRLVFDVQGVPITTRVASIRKVDWNRFQTNFFVVFPAGILEAAPQFYIVTSRTPDNTVSATIQRSVVAQFPNISAIDLTLILRTFDNILSRVAFVLRFMALFSIITGLTVLVGAVVTSRFQRIQESVLLRTLGATQKQVLQIMLIEYLFLGAFAAVTGLLLSLAGSWALAFFVFEATFTPTLWPLLLAFAAVILLTVGTGMLNSRGIHRRPPMEVLRREV